MTFLDRLELRLGRFALPGLIRYVVMLNALVFILLQLNPSYITTLTLDPLLVLRGEVWRLVTWIFLPTTTSLLWIFFYLMFTWWVGDMLEATWGTFRLNLYYLIGVLSSTLAAFLFGGGGGNYLLTFSLLLAIATVAPDMEILFFFLPLKLKWVALISLVYPWGLLFVTGSNGIRMVILVCLLNYFLFFGPAFFRRLREERTNTARRAKFEASKIPVSEALHRCATCGITEISHPEADFRVAENGEEYCTAHLPSRVGG